jgi:DNA-binding transcriptional MerR regulator
VPERSHLSIGEVLSLLRDEFPDVTISKIRFLESQGLVDPERTPSGYRKFYEHDVERLRWILRQQREHFLPLKVIRGRLTEQEGGEPAEGPLTPEEAATTPVEALTSGGGTSGGGASGRASGGGAPTAVAQRAPAVRAAPGAEAPGHSPFEAPRPARGEGEEARYSETGRAGGRAEPNPAVRTPAPARSSASTPSLFAGLHPRPPAPAPPEPATAARTPPTATGYGDDVDTYTAEELAASVGTDTAAIQELKQYGLITPHAAVAGVQYYDAGALAVSRAAAEVARHGVEARHLRTWRNSADREADLFQQVVLPLLRQRNPQARRQALETLSDLLAAGAALRAALVERAVRDIR